MENFVQIVSNNLVVLVLGLVAICFVLLVLSMVLIFKMRNVQKRVNRFFGSKNDRHGLELMLTEYLENVSEIHHKQDEIITLIDDINERMQFCIQKFGMIRFNPFDGMGGDLSFSLALLDEKNNGCVITTIHGRDASYTYTKPIIDSDSSYILSDEERKAIQIALDDKKIVASFHG